jgi:hypothetical protein
MDANEIVAVIKKRWDDWFDCLLVNDPRFDLTTASHIVQEYDSLLIEIGAIKSEEAKFA